MTYDVYICYSRCDREVASSVAAYLNKQQFKCYDGQNDISAGETYFNLTQKAIKDSRYFIYIYGIDSENSMWQRRELDLALSLGKRVISLLSLSCDRKGVVFSILCKRTECLSIKHLPYVSPEEFNDIRILLTKDFAKQTIAPVAVNNTGRKNQGKYWKKITLIAIILAALISIVLIPSFFLRSVPNPAPPQIDNSSPSFRGSPYDMTHPNLGSNPVQTSSRFRELLKYNRIIFLTIGLACGLLITSLIKRISKKNILFFCDANATISINNGKVKNVRAGELYRTRLKKGVYGIDFRADYDQLGTRHIVKTITDDSNHLICCEFLKTKEINFKCFIAGSIKLNTERDALRAKCAELCNKWDYFSIRVNSYTYQDFSRHVVSGGPQKIYDKFISEEANWAIFILQDGIGEKTLEEYNVALGSYFRNGHPKILILSYTNTTNDPIVMKIKNEVINHNQYWNTCNNIEEMKAIFHDCLQWDLILLNENRKENTK